jgi:hypothetical protein
VLSILTYTKELQYNSQVRVHKYSGSVGCLHLITAPVAGSQELSRKMRGQGHGGL